MIILSLILYVKYDDAIFQLVCLHDTSTAKTCVAWRLNWRAAIMQIAKFLNTTGRHIIIDSEDFDYYDGMLVL